MTRCYRDFFGVWSLWIPEILPSTQRWSRQRAREALGRCEESDLFGVVGGWHTYVLMSYPKICLKNRGCFDKVSMKQGDSDWIWSISSSPKRIMEVFKDYLLMCWSIWIHQEHMEKLQLTPMTIPPVFSIFQELRTLQESISQQKAERQAETSTMQLSLNEVSLRLEQLQQAGGFPRVSPCYGDYGDRALGGGKTSMTSCLFGKWSRGSGKLFKLKKQKNINKWRSCNKSDTIEECQDTIWFQSSSAKFHKAPKKNDHVRFPVRLLIPWTVACNKNSLSYSKLWRKRSGSLTRWFFRWRWWCCCRDPEKPLGKVHTHIYTQKGFAGKHTHPQVVSSTLRVKTIQLLKNMSSFF